MDQLYRGVETSLLVLTFVLGLAAATLPTFTARGPMEVTLPLISVAPDTP